MATLGARALATGIAALLLTACSGSQDRPPGDTSGDARSRAATPRDTPTSAEPEAGSGSTPRPGSDARLSQDELDRAVRRLPVDVDFGYRVDVGGQPYVETRGTFRGPMSWASRTEIRSPEAGEQSPVMHTVSIGREQWMQMEDWPTPMRGCWYALPHDQVPVGFEFMRAGVPVPLLVVDRLRSTPEGYGVRLDLAASLLTTRTVRSAALDQYRGSTRLVPVRVEIAGEAIETITVRAEDILATAPGSRDLDPAVAEALEQMEITLSFARGSSLDIVRPAPATVVPIDGEATTCH